jgi:hypothetical protein
MKLLTRCRDLGPAGLLVLALGCTSSGPDERPADPALAREALQTSLEAWKDGRPPASLHERQPPIRVDDEDYMIGFRLESYQVSDSVREVGNSLAYRVALNLKDRKGKLRRKAVVYCVATYPFLSVARQEKP